MPELGETRKHNGAIESWVECEVCGAPRWVQHQYGRPKHKMCRHCSTAHSHKILAGILASNARK